MRGWCIILVVMMHLAMGVGFSVGETGWLHTVVVFAKPFRMPDFFVIAGLFAATAMNDPFRRFVDRKVVHFAYFYAIWLFVVLLVKAQQFGFETPQDFIVGYLWHIIQPFSSTWFIQVLPLLYLAMRAVRHVPSRILIPVALFLHYIAAAAPVGGAYAMESQITGWIPLDGFMLFWIYFVFGTRFRWLAFGLAERAKAHTALAIGGLCLWGIFEGVAINRFWSEIHGLDLPFGLLGAGAVIVASTLLSKFRFMTWLAFLGRRSLIVYLAFFLPMAATRLALLKIAPNLDVGALSLVVTTAAIAGPLALERLLRDSSLSFMFERPRWAHLDDRNRVNKDVGHRHGSVGVVSP